MLKKATAKLSGWLFRCW